MTSEVTDAVLVARVRTGDRDAFALLHRRYCRMVHAILLARVAPQHAEDLVQDVFLVALEKLPNLRNAETFGSWIGQIARNRATDHHRTRRNVVELPTGLSRPPRPTAEVSQVLAAISALPDTYSETLLMRLVEGMTGPEIAERTGLTPGSVRVNLHRGMALLRERLGVEKST
jgi:RNA polymerase sigma-70 factor (ECF subfamily)